MQTLIKSANDLKKTSAAFDASLLSMFENIATLRLDTQVITEARNHGNGSGSNAVAKAKTTTTTSKATGGDSGAAASPFAQIMLLHVAHLRAQRQRRQDNIAALAANLAAVSKPIVNDLCPLVRDKVKKYNQAVKQFEDVVAKLAALKAAAAAAAAADAAADADSCGGGSGSADVAASGNESGSTINHAASAAAANGELAREMNEMTAQLDKCRLDVCSALHSLEEQR